MPISHQRAHSTLNTLDLIRLALLLKQQPIRRLRDPSTSPIRTEFGKRLFVFFHGHCKTQFPVLELYRQDRAIERGGIQTRPIRTPGQVRYRLCCHLLRHHNRPWIAGDPDTQRLVSSRAGNHCDHVIRRMALAIPRLFARGLTRI